MDEKKPEEEIKKEKEKVDKNINEKQEEKIQETEIKKETKKDDSKLTKELEELNDRYKRLFSVF